jgi:RimJ/RimL family protein N-acetyltransferase
MLKLFLFFLAINIPCESCRGIPFVILALEDKKELSPYNPEPNAPSIQAPPIEAPLKMVISAEAIPARNFNTPVLPTELPRNKIASCVQKGFMMHILESRFFNSLNPIEYKTFGSRSLFMASALYQTDSPSSLWTTFRLLKCTKTPIMHKDLASVRFEISGHHFSLIPLRSDYSSALAPIYGDKKTMKYFFTGRTFNFNEVHAMFEENSRAINFDKNPTNYYWAVLIRDMLCGVISMTATETPGEFEITRLLDKKVQKFRIGTAIFHALFQYFEHFSWEVTAHPDNLPSLASQKSAGFKQLRSCYVPGKGLRIISRRRSNARLAAYGQHYLIR